MPAAGGPKRTASGEKRQHYLDCARRLFAEFGYGAVGFEQIAETAGVSRATLLRSFRDKSVFLKSIGDEWLEGLAPDDVADDRGQPDVVARLLVFSERFLHSLRADQPTARIILSGLTEPIEEEEATILWAVMEAAIERLLPIVAAGQQEGVIRRGLDPRDTAGDWLRFLLGAALLRPADPKESEPATRLIETLLHGVLKTDV